MPGETSGSTIRIKDLQLVGAINAGCFLNTLMGTVLKKPTRHPYGCKER